MQKTHQKPKKASNEMFCGLSLLNASLLTVCFMTDVDTELLNQFVILEEELIRNNEDEMTVNW